MKKIVLLLLTLTFLNSNAQDPTVGLLYHDENVSDGYVLISPSRNNEVFLINPCGEKVNQWTFTETPGATCYLLANGNLLRAGKENLEIRDWENNVIWSYPTTANGIEQHHDIEPLPNGNILCIARDMYSQSAMTNVGRNPTITDAEFRMEKIVELQPIGTNQANVVWEWKYMDHLIQDFDATKANFGVVEDHPELLDVNFDNGATSDFIHLNGIDYNANLDQIIISARHLNEIMIIDHSTTTAEAASHSGGNSNKGGDFLWRWGNPQAYRRGTEADRKLFLQHNASWVEENYLDVGKISVFSNGEPGSSQTYSSVHLIEPEIVNGNYTMVNNRFSPADYDWSWSGSILGVVLSQDRQSGTHSLPNGNFIICEALLGRISEITKSGTLLWSYKNPTGIYFPATGVTTYYNQFSTIPPNVNTVFKADKYPPNYVGFTGKDLTPIGIIENANSLSLACSASLSSSTFSLENFTVQNPVQSNIISFNQSINADAITIYDVNGRIVLEQDHFSGNQMEHNLSESLYIMKITSNNTTKKFKLIIQ
ncbi:aryl-sulfate sulfotransferase [Flavobacterium sp.]|uniref:aryl-sulfate sulfotransferase n=1 Tax=Flavobacterium sp. TaxID=239 RepID=UPI002B4AAFBC|nr:aryl-sulfate sulfotransferase [Flavobacterium sp.]HLP63017.1 aryl-sulfate sulfotransferase [Flavobacterium sp.]